MADKKGPNTRSTKSVSQSVTDYDSDGFESSNESAPKPNYISNPRKELCIKLIDCLRDGDVCAALNEAVAPFIELAVNEAMGTKLTEYKKTIEKLKDENTKLQRSVNSLTDENNKLKERLDVNEKIIDEVNKVQRDSNIIIRGLPENSFAERASPSGDENATEQPTHISVEKTVTNFVSKEMGIDIQSGDIHSAFRFKAGTRDKTRPILIRFSNLKTRRDILTSRKILKEKNIEVYVSEHLTKRASDLMMRARTLVNKHKLHAAWARNGCIYIKKDPSSIPKMIKNPSDLPPLPTENRLSNSE